jgi:hypothetical protein
LPYSYYGELLEYSEYTLADHAVPGLTPRVQPRGPLVAPGKYTIELNYEGKTVRQPLTVEMDPRVYASQADLVAQRDLALEIARGMKSSFDSYQQMAAVHKALADSEKSLQDPKAKKAAKELSKQIEALETGTKADPGVGPVNRDLGRLLFSVENADMRPAEPVRVAAEQTCQTLEKKLAGWQQLNQREIQAFNQTLMKAKLPSLPAEPVNAVGCKQ